MDERIAIARSAKTRLFKYTIQSATMGGARLLRIHDELGSVEPGKIADLVAVPGDPLANISLMKDVSFVMKAGTVYKRPDGS